MPRPTKISSKRYNSRSVARAKLFDMTRPGSKYARSAPGYGGRAPLATRGFGSMAIASNRERKFFDIGVVNYQVNTGGSFTLLHAPVVGTDYTNRIGRKTVIKSLYIRGRVLLENSNANFGVTNSASQQARMIIFLDSQPNGAAPIVTDLLQTAEPAAQLNPNNRDRFKVIKDKVFTFDAMVINTTATQSYAIMNHTIAPIKCFKKLNIETIFNNGAGVGAIADINSGALYMFWIGSVAAGANVDTDAIVSTRVRFDDS